MTPRKALALAVLAGATTAPACAYIGIAHAQSPGCGGNSQVHPAPIDCEGTKTVQGVKGSVRLVVDDNGFIMVTAVVQDLTPNTPLPPLYLQVKAHRGISSNEGFEGRTDVFDGNTAAVQFQGPFFPAFDCSSQVDVKIVPGQPTLDHVSPVFRVVAPLVGLVVNGEICGPVPDTTVPTTAPATTVPGTSSPTTSPHSSTPGNSVSTTGVPSPSSVVGGNLPATGPRRTTGNLIGWAGALGLIGTLLVITTRKRIAS